MNNRENEENRYQRLVELGWDLSLLRSANVLVVGAGALGNEVLKNLALSSVGHIDIVDLDVIESSNLTRSVLFRLSDIGKYKAEVAAEQVSKIDSNVKAQSFVGSVEEIFGNASYRHYDAVFGCLDNTQARIAINRACLETGRLFIDGALRGISGEVRVFGPPFSVCFDCTVTAKMRQEAMKRYSCLKLNERSLDRPSGPTAPTISSIIGGLQVQIFIKWLHNLEVAIGKKIGILGDIDEIFISDLERSTDCPTHSNYERIDFSSVALAGKAVDQITVGELLDLAAEYLGSGATIKLDFDLVYGLMCAKCGYSKKMVTRLGKLYKDEAKCPKCSSHKKDMLMTQDHGSELCYDLGINKMLLSEVGIAPETVLRALLFKGGELRTQNILVN